MKRTILYALAGAVVFLSVSKISQASEDREPLLPTPEKAPKMSSLPKPIGATYPPLLGPAELAVFEYYRSQGETLNLKKMRRVLGSVCPELRKFMVKSIIMFGDRHLYRRFSPNLYREYKRNYEVLKLEWKEDTRQATIITEAKGRRDAPGLYKRCVNVFRVGGVSGVTNLLERYVDVHKPRPEIGVFSDHIFKNLSDPGIELPADYIFKCLFNYLNSLEGREEGEEEKTLRMVDGFKFRGYPIPLQYWDKIFSSLRTFIEAEETEKRATAKAREEEEREIFLNSLRRDDKPVGKDELITSHLSFLDPGVA